MIIVYGIPNCSSVKKARQWLDEHGLAYTFHNFKQQGVEEAQLTRWIDACGLARVLNRKGTTWRGLSDAERVSADTPALALALLRANPSLIKRPVIESGTSTLIGFDPTQYQQELIR